MRPFRSFAAAVAVTSFATLGTLGCAPRHAAQPAAASPAAPTSPSVAGLPAGWAWPADATSGVARPFDLASATRSAASCPPVEVSPGVWIAPICAPLTIVPPDAARALAVTTPPSFDIPLGVDLRAQGLDGPIMNQQMVGVCWTFAMSNTISNALRRIGRHDVVAPLHILAAHTWDSVWSKKPSERLVTEDRWPYDPVKACKLQNMPDSCGSAYHVQPGSWRSDPVLAGEVETARATGTISITKMSVFPIDALLTQRIAATIAGGRAVYVGMNIDVRHWSLDASSGRIADWANGDSGHGVNIVAYRVGAMGRELLVHNSWGTRWGDKGYAWLSEAMIARWATEAFVIDTIDATGVVPPEAIPPLPNLSFPTLPGLPTKTSIPTTLPTILSAPACGAGESPDLVFGSCARTCGNGTPRVAGICGP